MDNLLSESITVKKKRINYLDALKCLGILLVIEGHVRGGMGIKVYDTLPGIMLYSFNMPIFFFVSGFLAYREKMDSRNVLQNIWKKMLYLAMPAIAFRLVSDLPSIKTPVDYFLGGLGGYWFTIVLWECFLIYYAAHLLIRNDRGKMLIMVAFAIVGIGFLSTVSEYGPKFLDLNRLAKYLQYFVFGLLAMKYRAWYEKIMQSEVLKMIAIILFFGILFTINATFWPKPVFHVFRDIVLRYLGTFIVLSFFVCNAGIFDISNRINRAIMSVGQCSLAIYLLQYFFIPHFETFPVKDMVTVHILSFLYSLLILGLCMLFVLLLSNSKIICKYILGRK